MTTKAKTLRTAWLGFFISVAVVLTGCQTTKPSSASHPYSQPPSTKPANAADDAKAADTMLRALDKDKRH